MCKLLESKGFCFSAQLSSRWSPAVDSPSIMLSFLTFLGFPVDLTFSDGSFIHPAASLDFQVFLYCRCQVIKVYFDRKTQHFVPPLCCIWVTDSKIVSMLWCEQIVLLDAKEFFNQCFSFAKIHPCTLPFPWWFCLKIPCRIPLPPSLSRLSP